MVLVTTTQERLRYDIIIRKTPRNMFRILPQARRYYLKYQVSLFYITIIKINHIFDMSLYFRAVRFTLIHIFMYREKDTTVYVVVQRSLDVFVR